jgi:hypothetical protein
VNHQAVVHSVDPNKELRIVLQDVVKNDRIKKELDVQSFNNSVKRESSVESDKRYDEFEAIQRELSGYCKQENSAVPNEEEEEEEDDETWDRRTLILAAAHASRDTNGAADDTEMREDIVQMESGGGGGLGLDEDDLHAQVQSAIDSILNLQRGEEVLPVENHVTAVAATSDTRRNKRPNNGETEHLASRHLDLLEVDEVVRSTDGDAALDDAVHNSNGDSALDEAVRSILTS